MDKAALRKMMMEKRDSLSRDYVEESGRRVLENLLKAGFLGGQGHNPACAFIYVSMKNELPSWDIIRCCLDSRIKVCVPRIEKSPEGRIMKAYRIDDPDRELAPGHFGVMEPVFEGEEAARREVFPGEMDLVLMPGLAFDLKGNRIGYGKGYYDTFLARCSNKPIKIALAYDFQLLPHIAADQHDIPVDFIVTEKKVIRCR